MVVVDTGRIKGKSQQTRTISQTEGERRREMQTRSQTRDEEKFGGRDTHRERKRERERERERERWGGERERERRVDRCADESRSVEVRRAAVSHLGVSWHVCESVGWKAEGRCCGCSHDNRVSQQ